MGTRPWFPTTVDVDLETKKTRGEEFFQLTAAR